MAQKKTTPKSRALARSAGRAAGAQRAAAKKTSAKQERAAVSRSISKPAKVAEQGVGWGNVARAAASLLGRAKSSSATRSVTPKKDDWSSAIDSTYSARNIRATASYRATKEAQRKIEAPRRIAAERRAKAAESRRVTNKYKVRGEQARKRQGTNAAYKDRYMMDRKGNMGWK